MRHMVQARPAALRRDGGPSSETASRRPTAGSTIRPRLSALLRPEDGLPEPLKSNLEQLSGRALDTVRVHYNSARPSRLKARAMAQGSHIFLAPGAHGDLAHEAWHVVQQQDRRARKLTHLHGDAIDNSPRLEQEAETMAERAVTAPTPAAPPAVLQPAAAIHPAGQPVQRVLQHPNAQEVPERLRNQLGNRIKQFNTYGDAHRNTKQALHAQFRMLDDVERTINRHLRDHADTTTDEQRRALHGVLHETQQHHVALTERALANNTPLWLRDAGALGHKQQNKIQAQWQSLKSGRGNIDIQGDAAFRARTLSHFSRLLQGAHGRGLVSELDRAQGNPDRRITIAPGAESTAEPRTQPEHQKTGGHPRAGTGSAVELEPAPAAVPARHDLSTDVHGKPLYAPDFVTLGHELGHARRFLRGISPGRSWSDGDPLGGQDVERERWTDPEEHANITTEENPLRAEHDLPQRQYHQSISSMQAGDRRRQLTARIAAISDMVPAEHRRALNPLHIGPLVRDIHQADLATAETATALHGRLDRLETDLPGLVRRHRINSGLQSIGRGIRSALTPTRGKVAAALGGIGLVGGYLWSRQGDS